MDLRIFTEPQQGATYDDLLRVATASEDLGFDAFFRSDHLQRIGPGDPGPGPTDSWVALGGLARDTSRIRLGTLVTSATFRLPGPLAVAVAQVDAMSNGRIEFGIGAGWYETEHRAYGVPFPDTRERFDRLTEQLAIIDGLWRTPADETFTYDGKYYSLLESPALPKPVQSPRPPVIIGGKGKRRTPQLAARYADEFNVPFETLGSTGAIFEHVRAAVGSRTLRYSAAQTVAIGRNDVEVARRAAAIGEDLDGLRVGGLAGTPAQVVDKIGQFAQLGASRLYLQVLDLTDLDHLELIATAVAPQVAAL
ncbi:MAG TPA: LLM class F420-dependent oxidoreductase [Jatrophihabitantaceae bacterium]